MHFRSTPKPSALVCADGIPLQIPNASKSISPSLITRESESESERERESESESERERERERKQMSRPSEKNPQHGRTGGAVDEWAQLMERDGPVACLFEQVLPQPDGR